MSLHVLYALVAHSELSCPFLRSPTPWTGVYCASKAALHSLTQVLQMECKPLNISVVLVTDIVHSSLTVNQLLDVVPAPCEISVREQR